MKRNDAENISKKVVSLLNKARIEKSISKSQISKATGMRRTAITLIENNKNCPTLRSLLMLANSIGVDLKEVIAKAEAEQKK